VALTPHHPLPERRGSVNLAGEMPARRGRPDEVPAGQRRKSSRITAEEGTGEEIDAVEDDVACGAKDAREVAAALEVHRDAEGADAVAARVGDRLARVFHAVAAVVGVFIVGLAVRHSASTHLAGVCSMKRVFKSLTRRRRESKARAQKAAFVVLSVPLCVFYEKALSVKGQRGGPAGLWPALAPDRSSIRTLDCAPLGRRCMLVSDDLSRCCQLCCGLSFGPRHRSQSSAARYAGRVCLPP
jgi:hypothetical protein